MKTNRKFALIAGISILIMAIAAAFTYGYIHNTLVVPGNSEATLNNLNSNQFLFVIEILGWQFILLCDVVVAWALYGFFKNENRQLSIFTASTRIIYSAFLGAAIYYLIQISRTENGNLVMFFLQNFESTWSFGLIIFGFHLFLLGVLVLKSKYIHSFWGILLVFAAISYVIIHSSKLLSPEFESQIKLAETILSLPMAFGEIGFAFWLIIRGGKTKIVYKAITNSYFKAEERISN